MQPTLHYIQATIMTNIMQKTIIIFFFLIKLCCILVQINLRQAKMNKLSGMHTPQRKILKKIENAYQLQLGQMFFVFFLKV